MFDEKATTSENLAANGFGHRPHDEHGHRMVFRLSDGVEIGPMTCFEANDFLRTLLGRSTTTY